MRQAAADHRPLILVAEDDPVISEVLRDGFEESGFAVVEAKDPTDMFDVLRERHVSLVTLDLSLAGNEGVDLASRIRAERNLPVVIITGRDSPTDRLSGLEHGADDYITK